MRILAILILAVLPAAAQTRPEPFTGHFRASAPWLVENFRHAEVPRPVPPPPRRDPLLERLDDLQHATRSLVRQATLAGDYWAAASAIREARANLALIADIEARREKAAPPR